MSIDGGNCELFILFFDSIPMVSHIIITSDHTSLANIIVNMNEIL